MPFTVTCPDCRAPYSVKDEHRGLSLRCVRCQKVFPAQPAKPASGPTTLPARGAADPAAGRSSAG